MCPHRQFISKMISVSFVQCHIFIHSSTVCYYGYGLPLIPFVLYLIDFLIFFLHSVVTSLNVRCKMNCPDLQVQNKETN